MSGSFCATTGKIWAASSSVVEHGPTEGIMHDFDGLCMLPGSGRKSAWRAAVSRAHGPSSRAPGVSNSRWCPCDHVCGPVHLHPRLGRRRARGMGAALMPTHEHAARLTCTCVAAKQQPGIGSLKGPEGNGFACTLHSHGSCKAQLPGIGSRSRCCKARLRTQRHAQQPCRIGSLKGPEGNGSIDAISKPAFILRGAPAGDRICRVPLLRRKTGIPDPCQFSSACTLMKMYLGHIGSDRFFCLELSGIG